MFDSGILAVTHHFFQNTVKGDHRYPQFLSHFFSLNTRRTSDKMKDLLYFNGREGVPVPAVFKLEKSFRDEIFSKLERLLYLSHDLDSIRRDYLLARFTERPIPKPRVEAEKAKTEAKPKNKPKGNDELLDEPDTVGDAIELDDIVF